MKSEFLLSSFKVMARFLKLKIYEIEMSIPTIVFKFNIHISTYFDY